MSSDGDVSDDPNTVVIPVEDEKSDGDRATWPFNDPNARFSPRNDESWRIGLAQMWVERQMGAPEEGMCHRVPFLCFLHLYLLGPVFCLSRVGAGLERSVMS